MKTEEEANASVMDEKPVPQAEAGSLENFGSDLLPELLRKALVTKGFASLTTVQRSVVLADTNSRDVRISSQTGSGKTVAVGVAIGRELLRLGSRRDQIGRGSQLDERAPQVLLLTPTRELATQVRRELSWLFAEVPDAFVEVVTGGTSVGLERKSLSRGPRIVVGTPGRVLDHLKSGGFSGACIGQVVLDEADQMLDMGFRDELEGILEQLPKERRTHLVSATFNGEVRRIAERFQTNPVFLEGSPLGAANSDIEHVAHVVGFRHRYDALINILLSVQARRDLDDPGRTLVFTRTRADTLEVAERLQKDGMRAEPLSGDLAQAQRTRTLSAFRSGRVTTLVATDVAARGLDVQGVDLVVHLDPPENPDAYTHRSGRTGRAGRKGTSILLLPPQARARVERLLRAARVTPMWAPVPSADKVRKLYTKIGKKKLYTALEKSATPEELSYAQKIMGEHDPAQIIAQLLNMIEEKPPCLPREISEHIAPEHRAPKHMDARAGRRAEGRRHEGPWNAGRRPTEGYGGGDSRQGNQGNGGGEPRFVEGGRPWRGPAPRPGDGGAPRGGPKHRLGGAPKRFR